MVQKMKNLLQNLITTAREASSDDIALACTLPLLPEKKQVSTFLSSDGLNRKSLIKRHPAIIRRQS